MEIEEKKTKLLSIINDQIEIKLSELKTMLAKGEVIVKRKYYQRKTKDGIAKTPDQVKVEPIKKVPVAGAPQEPAPIEPKKNKEEDDFFTELGL